MKRKRSCKPVSDMTKEEFVEIVNKRLGMTYGEFSKYCQKKDNDIYPYKEQTIKKFACGYNPVRKKLGDALREQSIKEGG